MNYKYNMVYEYIDALIKSNDYSYGDKLPSINELSLKFNCSKSTIVKSYEKLVLNHKVYSKLKSGYYVVDSYDPIPLGDSSTINLKTGNLLINKINDVDLKHCLDNAVDIYKFQSLSENLYGCQSIRQLLTKYLSSFQVFTRPKNIYVNLGIQQALSILTAMPTPNNANTILIEKS